ncbi:ABC transporter permease [Nonomuraea lactucae]|uniref:ABC transporter permease n=1 Tax=Nonomuraea lactucae TaxID=2249762 RepID=UPI000DE34509|nr:ABC transporter permease [Nonomuraea lactucae]
MTLWLISVLVFVTTQALGDPARAILGRSATPDRLAALRERLHLDQPPLERYLSWLGGLLRGDLGTSLAAQEPVSTLIGARVANSSVLVAVSAVLIIPLAFLLALVAARRHGRVTDHAVQVGMLAVAALPEFVIGILLVAMFSTTVFRWLPSVSMSASVSGAPPWADPLSMILPVATLALAVVPYVSRILRASLIEVLESDYVEMARLKGVPERLAVRRHALSNAIVPGIQVTALQLAWLAGGVVVVEYLFQYPGIGVSLVDAVRNRDIPVIQALALLIAAIYVVVNLIADALTILVTPRLRTATR